MRRGSGGWKVDVKAGQRVKAGDRLAIIESVKIETPVISPESGEVAGVFCAEGRASCGRQASVFQRASPPIAVESAYFLFNAIAS